MTKRPLERVKNKTGRVDWLAAQLLEKTVEQNRSPLVKALYEALRDPIEEGLKSALGPRNRRVRAIRGYIEQGNKLFNSIASGSNA